MRTGEPPDRQPAALTAGRFTGRLALADHLRSLLALAAEEGWKELLLCDADFADWPLGEAAVVQSLQDWSRSGRSCTLMANSFSSLPQHCPRFVHWRRTWDHLISCRRCAPLAGGALLTSLWSPVWFLQRFDGERVEGYVGCEPPRRLQLRHRLDEQLQRSSPAFPATTLGL